MERPRRQAGAIAHAFAAGAPAAGHRGFAGLVLANLSRGAAMLVLVALSGIIIALAHGAWPALSTFGLGFFGTEIWNPVTEQFGALAPIYGTLVTSLIAMLIAVPVAIGIAVFLTELCPPRLRRPLGRAIELLAGVPSIVFGFWGLFTLAPFLQAHVQQPVIGAFDGIPVLQDLFAGPPYGIGVLTAGLVLAIMILPIMAAILRDVFETTPAVLKEAAYGVGATTWEVLRRIILPHARRGVIGAGILGLGRALGETMAVTFVIGNSHRISESLLAPGTTISAAIANEFSEATGPLYTSSLVALGLLLFVITFVVLAIARLLLLRMNREQHR
ncbi:MAG TPA: phosphate ABC transporter permease subunit PstC [Rhizomicrobium sp.]